MSSGRVVVTVGIEFYGQQPARTILEKADLECFHRPGSPGWPDAETVKYLSGMQGILAGAEFLNAKTMDHVPEMKVVARNGVGFDRVDLDYCTDRGIVVTNTPGSMADAVADLPRLSCFRATLAHAHEHPVTGHSGVVDEDIDLSKLR